MRPGESFEDVDVVNCYAHRPPYPNDIYSRIVELSPARHSLLDLGCGLGKIARRLSPIFRSITAIDASRSMLKMGRRSPGGGAVNISWVEGLSEEASYSGESFDVVVAAESIHWMDHARLFPRLRQHVPDHHLFVVAEGDGAFNPPWQSEWEMFLAK